MNLRAASAAGVQSQIDNLTPSVQRATPTNGQTVNMDNVQRVNTLWMTPADWTKIAEQTASNTITLAIVLQQADGEPWSLCRMIPAAKYVRIRSQSNAGVINFSINTTQQEVLM